MKCEILLSHYYKCSFKSFFSFKNKTKLKYSDLVCRIFEGFFSPTLQTAEDQNTLTEQDITILCYGQNTLKGKQQNSSKIVAGKHRTTDSYIHKYIDHNFLIPSKNSISILTNIPDSEAAEKKSNRMDTFAKI